MEIKCEVADAASVCVCVFVGMCMCNNCKPQHFRRDTAEFIWVEAPSTEGQYQSHSTLVYGSL